MTRWIISLLTITFLLCVQKSKGQVIATDYNDVMIFQKQKNKNKKIKLPLNDYYVLLKPVNQKKKSVIISGYTDTTLIIKIYSNKKGDERKAKKEQLAKIYLDTSLTISQMDSLSNLVMYSIPDTISISQVNKIIIPNSSRKEMKDVVNVIEWSAITWIIVGPLAGAIFKSFTYFIVWEATGIGIVTLSILTANKTINLDKWEIASQPH